MLPWKIRLVAPGANEANDERGFPVVYQFLEVIHRYSMDGKQLLTTQRFIPSNDLITWKKYVIHIHPKPLGTFQHPSKTQLDLNLNWRPSWRRMVILVSSVPFPWFLSISFPANQSKTRITGRVRKTDGDLYGSKAIFRVHNYSSTFFVRQKFKPRHMPPMLPLPETCSMCPK